MAKQFARSAATTFGIIALMWTASSLGAQQTNTLENQQLKDFQLPGTRTVPAQPQPQETQPQQPATQQPQTPVTLTPPPAPPAAAPATPTPQAPTTRSPRAEQARPRATPPEEVRPAPPAPSTPAPEAAAPVPEGVPAPVDLQQALPVPPPAAPVAEPEATAAAPEAEQNAPWPIIAGLGLLAILALLSFLFLKRSRAAEPEPAAVVERSEAPVVHGPDPLFTRREAANPPSPPAPASQAPPQPADHVVSVSLRPRLELEFKPDRAAATLTDTSVQFELTIRNVGSRTAHNVRIQVHMNNAGPGQDKEIDEFFAQPVPTDVGTAIDAIPPGSEASIRTGITLPKESVRELIVQGRQLFVPVVAFNVFYEWENGRTGQTSMSYIVGRTPPTPQDKMGAFRLDLGPRLYRSVGQRQGHLAKVV